MSALPATLFPPVRVDSETALASSDTAAMLESMLVAETIGDLRAAVMRGHAVHYGDGTSLLARDAIMGAAVGLAHCDEYLDLAIRGVINKEAAGARAWELFVTAAINACAHDLVDRMAERERITFGPKP